jgi:hypothetical protein
VGLVADGALTGGEGFVGVLLEGQVVAFFADLLDVVGGEKELGFGDVRVVAGEATARGGLSLEG